MTGPLRDATPEAGPTVVLVDIDGTLVDCQGQVRPLFAAALREVFGVAGEIDGYDFSGKLDSQIVLDLMRGAGLDRPAVERGLPRLRDRYLERLERELDGERIRLLPAVREFLDRLAGRGGISLALLTGNFREGARLKLRPHRLGGYFETGAFGEDGFDRRDLPPIALARIRARTGRATPPRDVWVIGDSVLDVDCARAHGLRSVAVATGQTGETALRAAGAEFVFPDLGAALEDLPLLA